MNEEDIFKDVVEMYLKERTLKSISDEIGVSTYRLSKYLKSKGVKIEKSRKAIKDKYIIGMEMYKRGKSTIQISKELGFDRYRFSQYMKRQGVYVSERPHKLLFSNNVFENIDTEEKAYWLGFLYADGCMRYDRKMIELGLSIKDEGHLYKFRSFLNSKHKVSYKNNKLGKSCRISISDIKLYDDLIKQGCKPRKSLTLTFPTENQVPKYLHKHFIRGYFDGDGSITLTENTVGINILGTREFLEGIKLYVDILKNKTLYPLKYNKLDKNTYRIQFEGINDIRLFLEYIYKDSNIYLDRKFNKYLEFICRAM